MKKKAKRRLTRAEKAVEVAKDVLAQLKARKFKATKGTYVTLAKPLELPKGKRSADLQDLIPQIKSCEVCAKGALFLSAVDKYNKCKVSQASSGPEELRLNGIEFRRDLDEEALMPQLKRIFSEAQLSTIEAAFEGWGSFYDWAVGLSPRARLSYIMRNIIKNGGEFRP